MLLLTGVGADAGGISTAIARLMCAVARQGGSVNALDNDLDRLARGALIAEIKRLRAGIREHRDSSGHELCWHQPKLWRLLPDKSDPVPHVPAWPQFLRGCLQYRQSLDRQLPTAPRTDEEFGRKVSTRLVKGRPTSR